MPLSASFQYQSLLLPTLLFAGSAAVAPTASMPVKRRQVIKNYGPDCHAADTAKGKVNPDILPYDLGTLPAAEIRQKVLHAINSGEMPP